tara:strand:+ start:324 stop:1328 length:1005 start_codon:yes stop_codon:yes gene_type:complete
VLCAGFLCQGQANEHGAVRRLSGVGSCTPDEWVEGRALSQSHRRLKFLRDGSLPFTNIVRYEPGPPTAALMPPGKCVLGAKWLPLPLLERHAIAHDVVLLTFGLLNAQQPLGLSTCACLLAQAPGPRNAATQTPVVRPYTPVSTNAMRGKFQLMVKVYPDGLLSRHLAALPIGRTVAFKHIPVNVKVQYPFHARKIVMLAGGTGVTPMLQALHALLGTSDDATRVTLVLSNKEQKDILAGSILDAWTEAYSRKLRVVHTLTREPPASRWRGRRGRIDKPLLEEYMPRPASTSGALIFVCGPPSFYETLAGPRGDKGLSGLLAEMGFRADQVVKF